MPRFRYEALGTLGPTSAQVFRSLACYAPSSWFRYATPSPPQTDRPGKPPPPQRPRWRRFLKSSVLSKLPVHDTTHGHSMYGGLRSVWHMYRSIGVVGVVNGVSIFQSHGVCNLMHRSHRPCFGFIALTWGNRGHAAEGNPAGGWKLGSNQSL